MAVKDHQGHKKNIPFRGGRAAGREKQNHKQIQRSGLGGERGGLAAHHAHQQHNSKY